MFARIGNILLVLGVLSSLAACSAEPAVESGTPPPSATVAEVSPTPPVSAGTQTNISFNCQNIQEIPLEECQALVALYKSTDGDHWADNSGWLATNSPCTWYGVICEQGHVVELQLYYNDLKGSLPAEIWNLTELRSLYLDANQLVGPVPSEIGKLTNLQIARLGRNQFSSIPAEMFGLENLIYLELWGNQLSGEIPAEIGNLSNLQELRLHSNQFTGVIPPELGQLASLRVLDLSHNQLDGSIPSALGDLTNLNELDLSANQLSRSIPPELEKLTSLYELDLSYNQLTGSVPARLTKAPISDLRLWGNPLDNTIPVSEGSSTPVEYHGIKFEFDSSLADSVWPELGAANPPVNGEFAWGIRPEHYQFTFANRAKPSSFQGGGIGISGFPQIIIYPTQSFRQMSEMAGERIEGLQVLLHARPSPPQGEIPLLPLINAAQVFHSQVKYVDFQNGTGVRFITHYSQDVSPIGNKNIFYTFQGLTDDGVSYVTAYFPITAAGLSDQPRIEDPNTFGARYQDYLRETVSHLNGLSPDEFEPGLDTIDAVIQSLLVAPR